MKILNTFSFLKYYGDWKIETYYRMLFLKDTQKEIGLDLKFKYYLPYQLSLNTQVGFIWYGYANEWKNLFNCGIGITYILKDSH
ncbi:MAG: hypothetical protein WCR42_12610 [bacterium]